MIKTELAHINLGKINPENIPDEIRTKIQNLRSEIKETPKTLINDEQITDLNKKLKGIR